jgi:hypothetical protein
VQAEEIIGQGGRQNAGASSMAQQQGNSVPKNIVDPVGTDDPSESASDPTSNYRPGSALDLAPTSLATTAFVAPHLCGILSLDLLCQEDPKAILLL